MSRPRIQMTYTRLAAGSYQTETLSGLYLQLLKGDVGWTVSSSTRSEGPFATMRDAKKIAESWQFVESIEKLGEDFKPDDSEIEIGGKYRLVLTTIDGEVIETIELGGEGYPLPIRRLGTSGLVGDINSRLEWWEKANPPAPEVPM